MPKGLGNSIEVWVLTCGEREPVTVKHLEKAGVEHQVYRNEDWDEPSVAKPNRLIAHEVNDPRLKRYYGLGAYRCFRGHQEILKRVEWPCVLVLEDDVKPANHAWASVLAAVQAVKQRFSVASLSARDIVTAGREKIGGMEWHTVRSGRGRRFKFALGSQAYLTTREVGHRIAELKWDKLPYDLVLYNKFHTGILQPVSFYHVNQGSLIK